MTLEEKYKLHFINGQRYYEFDMKTALPFLEDTVPYLFKYKDIEIYNSAWNRMTIDILAAIDKLNPKTEEELLKIHYYWTKTDIFSKEKKTNFIQYKNLYVNTNHTATHAMMNIQGLLKAYDIPLEECYFMIRRHISAEPLEVREFYRAKTIADFKEYLALMSLDEERIGKISNNVLSVNKYFLSKISSGFNDFYLFDNYYYFTNYKIKVIEYITTKTYLEEKKQGAVKRCLNYLDNFYKYRTLIESLISNKPSSDFIKSMEEEIDKLFESLHSKVIVANKLYARLKILYPQEVEKLGELNNNKGIYLIASTYFAKKYTFKEPYICIDNKTVLENDEIIYSYAYSLDEITISKLNQYAEKMHLKKLDNYLEFINSSADTYVQVAEGKLVSKEKMNLPPEQITKIKKELTYYIESFGKIDSETYNGYQLMPNIGYEWNKYLLLGICRSYIDEIKINYKGNTYKIIDFELKN